MEIKKKHSFSLLLTKNRNNIKKYRPPV